MFGDHFGRSDFDLLLSIGCGEFFRIQNALFFFDNRPFDHYAFTDDFLNVAALDLDRFLFFHFGHTDNPLALDRFQCAVAFEPFELDGVGPPLLR
ncbi:MAG: hypothetical protein R3C56_19235 [Pirellulaceae bacterium]